MKFGFYTSGNAGRLKKMLENQLFSSLEIEVPFLLHDNGHDPVLEELANRAGIPAFFVDYLKDGITKQKGKYISDKIYTLLQDYQASHLFCFGGKILRGELLTAYENRLINFHPSLLPMFPGLSAIDRALEENAFFLGNTAHFIDEGIDTGPIIMQSIIHRSEYKGYESLLDQQIPILLQIADWIKQERIQVEGRLVTVDEADYGIGPFVPHLEDKIEKTTQKLQHS